MNVWQKTDIGLVRKSNQDACAVTELAGMTLCVVCDGMGGTAGGQVASNLAVESFTSYMQTHMKPLMKLEVLDQLGKDGVAAANHVIHEEALHSEQYRNMGTTLVAALIHGTGAIVWNVGDSRAYHVSKNGIRQISKDHSLVESLVESGELTQEEARFHPKRNYITRALGTDAAVLCDSYIETCSAEDCLLLCSDGLMKTVDDQEMLFEIIHGESLDNSLDRLFDIAKERGAPDNVTAVLVQLSGERRLD
ncbi:Stp1/IreP family PP2C-type Ser/Thr phosphatase [Bengtsoniella intestinalis]|uniref:Stp1/IreP family PP2C-type Ser/Thr phosphatase n=1 Tax=Bengtsoniella intestinalis TaxID=3073143 RepID=UPI00391FA2E2